MAITTRRKVMLGSGAAIIVGIGAYRAITDLPEDLNGARFFAENGVAIRGADPVAYFTKSAPVIGTSEYSYDWGGVAWRFANAEHQALFRQRPEAYAPQYGGYCAWAVAERGRLYSTQPRNWAVVNDKLYLNFNDKIQERWNGDIAGFISRGDQRWPEIANGLA